MKKTILTLGVGVVLGIAATAATVAMAGRPVGDEVTVTVSLKNVTPSSVVTLLAAPRNRSNGTFTEPVLPPGVTQVNPDDAAGKLTVRGQSDDVSRVREIARLLDYSPQPGVRLSIRIWRMEGLLDTPNPPRRLVATAVTQSVNNRIADVTAVGDGHVFQIRLLPQVNDKKTVTLITGFGATRVGVPLARYEETTHSTRRVKTGMTALFSATMLRRGRDIGEGKASVPEEPRFGYAMEVTPETMPLPPTSPRLPLP
jgi:hypothetical protein